MHFSSNLSSFQPRLKFSRFMKRHASRCTDLCTRKLQKLRKALSKAVTLDKTCPQKPACYCKGNLQDPAKVTNPTNFKKGNGND